MRDAVPPMRRSSRRRNRLGHIGKSSWQVGIQDSRPSPPGRTCRAIRGSDCGKTPRVATERRILGPENRDEMLECHRRKGIRRVRLWRYPRKTTQGATASDWTLWVEPTSGSSQVPGLKGLSGGDQIAWLGAVRWCWFISETAIEPRPVVRGLPSTWAIHTGRAQG